MKKLLVLAALAAVALSCAKKDEYGYTIKDNQIVYNTPARPADQQSMLGFAAEPIEHVRVALVGLATAAPAPSAASPSSRMPPSWPSVT